MPRGVYAGADHIPETLLQLFGTEAQKPHAQAAAWKAALQNRPGAVLVGRGSEEELSSGLKPPAGLRGYVGAEAPTS